MQQTLRHPWRAAVALVLVTIAAAGCSKNNASSAATTTPTPTPVAPTTTNEFDSTVPVGGSTFYSFSVSQYGTINITLTSVGGADVPPTVMLGLGLGTPSGTACSTTSTTNAAAGSTAQLTGSYDVGVYCAKVSDIGNLFAPASFTLSIAHPMRPARFAMAAAVTVSLSGCGSDPITSPSSTAAGSAQTEFFSGTVWPGSESSYAFDVNQPGLVTETLGSVTMAGGSRAAVDATLVIGFGIPSGTGCGRSQSVDTRSGLMPQLGASAPAGIYCADVSAPAGAPGPFDFVLRIVHP